MRRVVFCVTPGAAQGRALDRLNVVLSTVPELRARSRTTVLRSFHEARDVVEKLASDEIPVAAGGDGTVNLLARALRAADNADRPLAMLPLGTGNAFGYRFGQGTVTGALRAIEAGRPLAIDVMRTTHPDFPLSLISISAGFESRMLASVPRGVWTKWIGLIPALLRVAPRSWTGIGITVDGESLIDPTERVYNAGLYNLPYYGFGRLMWPDADAADGAAEVVVCRSRAAYWRVLRRGLRTARSGDGDPTWRRWRHARVRADRDVQIDGEVAAGGDFEVLVEPRGLTVLVAPEHRRRAQDTVKAVP